MKKLINVYADESCHLESNAITKDNRFMVLGGISCPDENKKYIFEAIKNLKEENKINRFSEIKWVKVTKNKIHAYEALVKYFFSCDELSFRAIIVDKKQLKHDAFNHTHDQFYYKMYWQMLEWFIEQSNRYNIYLDIKDTQGSMKIKNLHTVLCNTKHDFNRQVIENIQEIRSHEIVLTQLVDILIGAISYANRYPAGGKSHAKQTIVDLIKSISGLSLINTTSLGARKFNIFRWEGK